MHLIANLCCTAVYNDGPQAWRMGAEIPVGAPAVLVALAAIYDKVCLEEINGMSHEKDGPEGRPSLCMHGAASLWYI